MTFPDIEIGVPVGETLRLPLEVRFTDCLQFCGGFPGNVPLMSMLPCGRPARKNRPSPWPSVWMFAATGSSPKIFWVADKEANCPLGPSPVTSNLRPGEGARD